MNKRDTTDAAFFALPEHRILALHGRDAIAFAQAQTMNDLGLLADGHWQWNGWLTPKGRLIALFALLRIDSETLWALVADTDVGEIARALQRFVFRSKVAITPREDLRVTGAFASPVSAAGARLGGSAVDGVELDMQARTLRISVVGTDTDAPDDDAQRARWRGIDLAHGLPRLDPSQSELWTPQQLSLQRLRAYSVKKGCYPGQEIVARTHFLGQAKRGLVALRAAVALQPGDDVDADGRSVGPLVSTACDPQAGAIALAVLPLDLQASSLHVRGVPVDMVALRDGLAR